MPNAGGITTWLRRLGVVADGSWPAIRDGAVAEAARRGADRGTWCVPAIFGLGTPRWGSAPRADIVGLTAGSEAADVAEAALLGVACLVAYWVETHLLAQINSVSGPDDLLGGMWAAIAAIFVFRDSYQRSVTAAASRISATLASFVLCLIYLAFLPFHIWGLALLAGASALAVTLLGRPDDAITAAITTTVIMVVVAVSPAHAWEQPILRFIDTVVGVVVGVAAAWFGLRVIHPRMRARPR